MKTNRVSVYVMFTNVSNTKAVKLLFIMTSYDPNQSRNIIVVKVCLIQRLIYKRVKMIV